MTFISYAQNFEDVMLLRALKHVEKGFYIDVGANDPSIDSVTKAFYERGWHGINIEPLPTHYADLVQERPQDINLQCAAGATNGEIEVWECDVRGWTTASANVIAQHTANGHVGAFHKVPVFRLSDICEQHVSGEIHFLKIDVEGFEKSVIDGMDFSRFRPWILVIEATKPNSTEEIHDEWEGDVLSADYLLAYIDGLNRFYVAKEQSELLNPLRYPPNVFDGFIRSEQMDSELRAQQAEAKAQQAETKAQQAFMQLHSVYASTSWRITAPLRAFTRLAPKLLPRHYKSHIKLLLKHAALFVNRRPRLRNASLELLNRMPGVKRRLAAIVNYTPAPTIIRPYIPPDAANLLPRARQIYADLKAALARQHEEHD